MTDPISTGMVCASLVALALIGKSWAAQSGATRVEVAKIEAQQRDAKRDEDIDMAIETAEEALKRAADASEAARMFGSRLSAVENRARR